MLLLWGHERPHSENGQYIWLFLRICRGRIGHDAWIFHNYLTPKKYPLDPSIDYNTISKKLIKQLDSIDNIEFEKEVQRVLFKFGSKSNVFCI